MDFGDNNAVTIVVLLYMHYPTACDGALSMFACKYVYDRLYLIADMQEACYEGRHEWMLLMLGLPQMCLYVVGLPLAGLLLLWRKRHKLTNAKCVYRYGLLYTGYRQETYYWEFIVVLRKASVVVVSVFGILAGVEDQTLLTIVVLFLFLLLHIMMRPFDTADAHQHVLHLLESGALSVCFLTMWSGLVFFRGKLDGDAAVVLTIVVFTLNTFFMGWALKRLILETMYENGLKFCWESREQASARARLRSKARQAIVQKRVQRLLADGKMEKSIFMSKTTSLVLKQRILRAIGSDGSAVRRKKSRRSSISALQTLARDAVIVNYGDLRMESFRVKKTARLEDLNSQQIRSRERLQRRLQASRKKAL